MSQIQYIYEVGIFVTLRDKGLSHNYSQGGVIVTPERNQTPIYVRSSRQQTLMQDTNVAVVPHSLIC